MPNTEDEDERRDSMRGIDKVLLSSLQNMETSQTALVIQVAKLEATITLLVPEIQKLLRAVTGIHHSAHSIAVPVRYI